ncbi:hypothetical protein [Anaeroselena agilis]|uniref:Uncharacterized protein n=1 Tax=Anaeroselena agilis TaxID=3063788 RepID=A0ABU3P2X4_9FIRM|nr:hypothetical protein [Selenomonadales bacterium 4137-cl]
MFTWRITKYNPDYRDELGRYSKREWTSFSEIGSSFDGHELTKSEYLAVEDAYVDAIVTFMGCIKATSLKVIGLEKGSAPKPVQELYSTEMSNLYATVRNHSVLSLKDVQLMARLVLREDLWCKLESVDNMFVHFGYDYYMYIGCIKTCEDAINKIMQKGLFVEKHESPYA